MFAIFNLGVQEIIILAIIGFLTVGIATALFVVLLTNRDKGRDDSGAE